VTQIFVLVILQIVRSILDINYVSLFCTLVPDVCCCRKSLPIYGREERRKASRCSYKVSIAANLSKNWCMFTNFATVFSVGFHENPISGSGLVATEGTHERTERWRVESQTHCYSVQFVARCALLEQLV
jgi:hypothetical protein